MQIHFWNLIRIKIYINDNEITDFLDLKFEDDDDTEPTLILINSPKILFCR